MVESMEEIALKAHMAAVDRSLSDTYRDYAHGNKKNPLAEFVYIVCSIKTTEKYHRETYEALRKAFPTFESLSEASETEISQVLARGGFQGWKARTILAAMRAARTRFGRTTLAPLTQMTDTECEEFLTSLPGIGKKVARCVMMYSLGRDVFPVDTNCWRIAARLGWIPPLKGQISQRDMDRLQNRIPEGLRYTLHVNMVSHGRMVCLPKKPACLSCSLFELCPRVGVELSEPPPTPDHSPPNGVRRGRLRKPKQ